MKLPNKYVCIDIETTGTEADYADVIQIGAAILNEDLSSDDRWVDFIKPMSDYRNPEAMRVNEISEETLAAGRDPQQSLADFEEWAMRKTGMDRPLLAAWGTYFDITFMRAYYKKIGRKWPFSYRCLDLKSIAIWEAAKKDQSAAGGVDTFLKLNNLEFKGKAHDALSDIINTIRIIQSL